VVIYERLAPAGREHCDATMAHLETYGNQGLRTLCLAYRCTTETAPVLWTASAQCAAPVEHR
jgi:predicted kinase